MLNNTPMADRAYAQGDIVWAYYPLTDKIDKHKKRPVLIISNKTSNDLDNDYIVLPITRAIRSEPFSSLLLEKIGELATEKVQVASAYMCQSIRVS